jgi:hypothetical protein
MTAQPERPPLRRALSRPPGGCRLARQHRCDHDPVGSCQRPGQIHRRARRPPGALLAEVHEGQQHVQGVAERMKGRRASDSRDHVGATEYQGARDEKPSQPRGRQPRALAVADRYPKQPVEELLLFPTPRTPGRCGPSAYAPGRSGTRPACGRRIREPAQVADITVMTVWPILILSPFFSPCGPWMRRPLSQVPLVERRSSTYHRP